MTKTFEKSNKKINAINVAFDIDDTIWMVRPKHCDQVPDFRLISVLLWFVENGDNVFVWSGGGVEYAKTIVNKLGLDDYVTVIAKPPLGENDPKIDLSFDDSEITLGKTNVLVYREHNKKRICQEI